MNSSPRRRAPILASVILIAVSASACQSEPTTTSAEEVVTIEHALGTAEIVGSPERIVTLGQGSAETVIALGTVPVGVEDYPWGSDETGYLPWVHEALEELDAPLPAQFTGAEDLDVEAVAALEPDLVLAPWSGLTQAQYDQLSQIAPTVAYDELPWTTTWDDQIEVIGRAMGQEEEASGLVEEIEDRLGSSAKPEYEGLSFSFIYNEGPGSLGVFMPTEQRVAMVAALGLTPDPVADTLEETEGTDSAKLSLEHADVLDDSDLLFTFYSDEDNRRAVEEQPAYASIPAIERGSYVAPTDQPFVTGSSMINPLTVPWALERYVPMIDEAADQL